SRATRLGSVIARRLAASPVSTVPSSRRNTTDGIVGARSPKDTISTRPARWNAAAVHVVPRSMPSCPPIEPAFHAYAAPPVHDNQELADRLFAAIEKGDVDCVAALYADDAVIWHNFDGIEQPRDANLVVLS